MNLQDLPRAVEAADRRCEETGARRQFAASPEMLVNIEKVSLTPAADRSVKFDIFDRPMSTKTINIRPARGFAGTISLPGDKSISHRYAMLGAIAEGTTKLE